MLHQHQVEVWGQDRTSNMAFVHYAKLKAPANERFQRWCKVGTRGEPTRPKCIKTKDLPTI